MSIGQAFGFLPQTGRLISARSIAGIDLPWPRSCSVTTIFGTFGYLTLIGLGYTVGLLFTKKLLKESSKLLLFGVFLMLLLSVFLTQDRSTWLACFVLLLVFCFIKGCLAIRILLAIIVVLTIVYAGYEVWNIVVSIRPKTVERRLETFYIAMNAFLQHPFFGIGWQMDLLVNVKGKLLHNSFLALLAYFGLFGTIPHIVLMSVHLITLYMIYKRACDPWVRCLSLGTLLGTVGWFVENNFYLGVREYGIWILYGFTAYLATKSEIGLRKRQLAVIV